MEVSTITSALAPISEFLTASLGWIGEVVTTVAGEPYLMVLCFGMPIVGFAVGLLRRLISL